MLENDDAGYRRFIYGERSRTLPSVCLRTVLSADGCWLGRMKLQGSVQTANKRELDRCLNDFTYVGQYSFCYDLFFSCFLVFGFCFLVSWFLLFDFGFRFLVSCFLGFCFLVFWLLVFVSLFSWFLVFQFF